jgi:hypothetical protein
MKFRPDSAFENREGSGASAWASWHRQALPWEPRYSSPCPRLRPRRRLRQGLWLYPLQVQLRSSRRRHRHPHSPVMREVASSTRRAGRSAM